MSNVCTQILWVPHVLQTFRNLPDLHLLGHNVWRLPRGAVPDFRVRELGREHSAKGLRPENLKRGKSWKIDQANKNQSLETLEPCLKLYMSWIVLILFASLKYIQNPESRNKNQSPVDCYGIPGIEKAAGPWLVGPWLVGRPSPCAVPPQCLLPPAAVARSWFWSCGEAPPTRYCSPARKIWLVYKWAVSPIAGYSWI